ncbi:hypothetical protein JB92DRAFT_2829402 [Gautieria morchelliformis]|nr:hypothetical protein JB92DRAFT_2829402 [Gautieria morchelliformis]
MWFWKPPAQWGMNVSTEMACATLTLYSSANAIESDEWALHSFPLTPQSPYVMVRQAIRGLKAYSRPVWHNRSAWPSATRYSSNRFFLIGLLVPANLTLVHFGAHGIVTIPYGKDIPFGYTVVIMPLQSWYLFARFF